MTVHQVPYYAQWESAGLVPEFLSGARASADDPSWAASGAADPGEYAFWAPRACGIACLRMALGFWGRPVPPAMTLVATARDAGAYIVRDGDRVEGLVYAPFAAWAADAFRLDVRVRPRIDAAEAAAEVHAGRLVMLSVHPSIRSVPGPGADPPVRGGHLVLAVGAGPRGLVLHNPSGLPGHSQRFHPVSWGDFDRFAAGRGIVLGPSHVQGEL
ncbi:C39 family peptidase [Streptomyces sp. NPDC059248]|uniref:C39 family peptidase n=1 Tax=Streptomyces sp. NPDC059248 TaxID=3346791 RepID=UPI00368493B3